MKPGNELNRCRASPISGVCVGSFCASGSRLSAPSLRAEYFSKNGARGG
jgi:hypothetical protein